MDNAAARDAGGVKGTDRHGVIRFSPCTTESIGAVCIEPGIFDRAQDVANEATAAKYDAKSTATSPAVRHPAATLTLVPEPVAGYRRRAPAH